ncbi:MAG: hypothetical protein HY360_05105 [Verrucomicrobia bacterium]|nr:hypothetical protein [Verrucomicrobiota bacterium]
MKSRLFILTFLGLAWIFQSAVFPVDKELDELKERANQTRTTLKFDEKVVQDSARNRDYTQKTFDIDTESARFRLQYKSFLGEAAADNPKELNDGSSGYGLVEPSKCWYWQGAINASLRSSKELSIATTEGQARILQQSGPRAAYDLVFDLGGPRIVIRTAALAGRSELFFSVHGDPDMPLKVWWRGYPCGYDEPRDRCVHVEGAEIRADSAKTDHTVPLELEKAPWLLLTDHRMNSSGNQAHQLGLVFKKAGIEKAQVVHRSNYAIEPEFLAESGQTELRFMICDFEVMSIKAATDALAALARQADELMDNAFKGLPQP